MQFQNFGISINNQKIVAQSFSISESNNLNPVYGVGFSSLLGHAINGPLENVVNLEYLIETNNEPNYDIITALKTYQDNPSAINLKFGGNEVEGYLTNYRFSISPNNILSASVSYRIFTPITGAFQNQDTNDSSLYNESRASGFSHYWTASVVGGGNTGEIIEIGYSFDADWKPTYKIGSPYPYKVDFLSADESIEFLSEYNIHSRFSGQYLTGISNSLQEINIRPISSLYTGSSTSLSFSIANSKVTQSSTDVSRDNIITTKTIAINNY